MDFSQDLKQDGFEVDYKGSLIFYEGNDEDVTVPGCVLEIGPGAFNGNLGIKKVVLPNGLQKIGCIPCAGFFVRRIACSA